MELKKLLPYIGGALVLIGSVFLLTRLHYKAQGNLGAINSSISSSTDVINYSSDVIGTHIGTTTVGVDIESTATTSYVSRIGRGINLALYTVKVLVASTTNNLNFGLQGSNDFDCDTSAGSASSTTDVIQSNINWFNAGDFEIGKAQSTAQPASTTSNIVTLVNASTTQGTTIALTQNPFQCLRLQVSGVSTTIYAGLSTK